MHGTSKGRNDKALRRHHHKVRTGCDDCKRRRIKCDELKPECRRCLTAGIKCSGYNSPKVWLFEPGNKKTKTNTDTPQAAEAADRLQVTASTSSDQHLEGVQALTPLALFAPTFRDYAYRSYNLQELPRIWNTFQFTLLVYGPSYVWRVHTDESERQIFRPNFINDLVREPAMMEAVLAAASLQLFDRAVGIDADRVSLQHYSRALSLLQKRLTTPSAALDNSIFWSLIAILVFNQEIGDWKSFGIHFAGLRQIVSLRGGIDALHSYTPRASAFINWAESCYMNNAKLAQGKTIATANDRHPRYKIHHQEPQSVIPSRFQLPHGIKEMTNLRLLRPQVIELAHNVILWLNKHTTESSESLTDNFSAESRMSLAADLEHTLGHTTKAKTKTPTAAEAATATASADTGVGTNTEDIPALTPNEYLLCLGMFIIIISLPPGGLVGRYYNTMNPHLDVLFEMVNLTALHDGCLLWVAMLTSSVQVYFGISLRQRWYLLERYVEMLNADRAARGIYGSDGDKDTAGGKWRGRIASTRVPWSEVAPKIEGFPQPVFYRSQWNDCWELANKRVSR